MSTTLKMTRCLNGVIKNNTIGNRSEIFHRSNTENEIWTGIKRYLH
ncbi:hypothetical protein RXV94_12820 [Yeosuana sp. MJ-SS3]|uniref:Transposase n=1 Tax=Gilvirhabdus luticola TaxID=3079858 RepID=A0ABU3U9H5_9FLAO|nr:hypothetical protein [Yeosuana sp. MJ-SS3]MDU8887045.1 hypothetical protein [Yeosuana sp. MJ-SS3]